MRQLDKPPEESTDFGPPVNRKAPEAAKPQQVKEGIVEMGGKLMTDIAKNAAAPDDTPEVCWSEWFY